MVSRQRETPFDVRGAALLSHSNCSQRFWRSAANCTRAIWAPSRPAVICGNGDGNWALPIAHPTASTVTKHAAAMTTRALDCPCRMILFPRRGLGCIGLSGRFPRRLDTSKEHAD